MRCLQSGAKEEAAAAAGTVEEQPITPHAAPIFDAQGHLTYVGDDGRRYVVAAMPEADEQQVDRVMDRLRCGNVLFSRLELLAREWLQQVSGDELDRRAALALLLTTLETALDGEGCDDAP